MEAHVYLKYAHSLNPSVVISVVISARRIVRHNSPLAKRLLVYYANRNLGDVWMAEQVKGTKGPCLFVRNKSSTCIKVEAGRQIQQLGGHFVLDLDESWVGFENCAVPSAGQ